VFGFVSIDFGFIRSEIFMLRTFSEFILYRCKSIDGSAKQSGKGKLVLDRKRQSLPPPYSKTPS